MEFQLNVRQEDGATLREHLESAERQTGETPPELAAQTPLPPLLAHIWDYFNQLNNTRQNYGWGPVRFSYAEIEAWSRLRKIKLDPWELDALLKLDDLFIAEADKANKNAQGNN